MPAARTRASASGGGTGRNLTLRSRSPVVVLISATASARCCDAVADSAQTTTMIAMPPIEWPAMTARSPGASVASSTASRSAAR